MSQTASPKLDRIALIRSLGFLCFMLTVILLALNVFGKSDQETVRAGSKLIQRIFIPIDQRMNRFVILHELLCAA